MKYNDEDIKKMNQTFRESLKPNWLELDFSQTDKGKGLPKPNVCKTYKNGEIFDLNVDVQDISAKTLYDVIMSRRSVRKYDDQELTKKELIYLCKSTSFIIKHGPGYAMGVVPTGGATSTLETYFYLNKVEGFERGMYHYMKDTNNLQFIDNEMSRELVNDAIMGQLRGAAFVVFWTVTPYRGEFKYQFATHKMAAMEAGHACQNLYLAAESIECGAVAIGAYDQKKADQLLNLDEEEFVIYAATVGKKPNKK